MLRVFPALSQHCPQPFPQLGVQVCNAGLCREAREPDTGHVLPSAPAVLSLSLLVPRGEMGAHTPHTLLTLATAG